MIRFSLAALAISALLPLSLAADEGDIPSLPTATLASLESAQGSESSTLAVPEPSRLVLLGVGVLCVGTAYRRAWVNMRRSGKPS